MRQYITGCLYQSGTVKDAIKVLGRLPVGAVFTAYQDNTDAYKTLEITKHKNGWSVNSKKISRLLGTSYLETFTNKKRELADLLKNMEMDTSLRVGIKVEFDFLTDRLSGFHLKKFMLNLPLEIEYTLLKLRVDDSLDNMVYLYEFYAPEDCDCFIYDKEYHNSITYHINLPELSCEKIDAVLRETCYPNT